MLRGFAHDIKSNEEAISRGENSICGPRLRKKVVGLQRPHNLICSFSHFTAWSTITGMQAGHVINVGYPDSGCNIR
jgi:hypothetical protein